MNYPTSLINEKKHNIFGTKMFGNGVGISLADDSFIFEMCDVSNQSALQNTAENLMNKANTNWAVSHFGERRENFFRTLDAKQMVDQSRFYHLGVDLWMPIGSELFAPLTGEVVQAGYEEGFGNYGGFVLLKHTIGKTSFYSFYGHLENGNDIVKTGQTVNGGEIIGRLGSMQENGGYFFHVHLQVLTEEGYQQGFMNKGYADAEVFANIQEFVLDPNFLIV